MSGCSTFWKAREEIFTLLAKGRMELDEVVRHLAEIDDAEEEVESQ